MRIKHFLILVLLGFGQFAFSQVNSLELKPENEKKFNPYMLYRHGGSEGLAEFKKNHPHDYLKELWYYSESFYIKKNHLAEGIELDAAMVCVSRFENQRKSDAESIVILPGFKDAIVLLPVNQLIFKP